MEYKEFPFGESWDLAKTFVNQLSPSEMVQFFYETFGEKTVGEKGDNGEFHWRGHYALAEISQILDDDKNWEPREIEFIAKHNPKEYPGRMFGDQPICQGGACAKCNSKYQSYRKHLICPVCKSSGYGT